ncbi:MAG: hydrogenase small subunit [Planctomycetota bacterium]
MSGPRSPTPRIRSRRLAWFAPSILASRAPYIEGRRTLRPKSKESCQESLTMTGISRRHFLKIATQLAAAMGLGTSVAPRVARALQSLARGQSPVLWLQGQSCSGCSVSLLNSTHPNPATLLTRTISLQFHQTLSAATGETCAEIVKRCVEKGGYILAVEGSVPAGMPEACVFAHEPFTSQVVHAARGATSVVAVGSCASFGGIPAAAGNTTGALGVPDFLVKQGVTAPMICLPGCPSHPDWVIGTLVHVLEFGLPSLDDHRRPTMFYGKLIHDQCPRFPDYERERYATTFAEDGCLFKLGCLGTLTHADCTMRLWNGGTSSCIHAHAPCIGCASELFARSPSFPFLRHNERHSPPEGSLARRS